jgi:hypothetical protein
MSNRIKVGFVVKTENSVVNVSRSTMTVEQIKSLVLESKDPTVKKLANTVFAVLSKKEEQDQVIARLRAQVDQLQKERRAFYG